ncbi:MAG: serine O-acetyltransferase [Enterobacterales bacterium]|jgi:serine O-acetyltransferase
MDGEYDSTVPPLPDGSSNQNPIGISFVDLVREDFRTHESHFLAGFWVVLLHRYGNWRMGIRNKVLRLPFSLFYKLLSPIFQFVFGIQLPYTVKLGRRVKIEHFGGMILVAREIGDDVTIRQNTTMGIAKKSQLNGKPIIRNGVDIGCGVAILGNVIVGENSVVGANAVVVKDVPPNALVGGVPAKVIRQGTEPD